MKFSQLLKQSLIGRGVYFITLFGVNIVLSRYLGAAKTGVVYYISNTFALVQLLAGLCLENGITFFASGRRIAANQLFALCLLWVGIVAMLQIFFYRFVPLPTKAGVGDIRFFAFCFVTGLLLTAYSANLFYADRNFILPNLILSALQILFILFVITTGTLQKESVQRMVLVYFFMLFLQGVCIAVAYALQHKVWQQLHLPKAADIKKFTSYSLSVLLFNVLLFFVYRVDYYFVRYSPVCSADNLGNYIQASKLGQMLLVVPQIIGSAVYPQVSSGNDVGGVSRMIVFLAKAFAMAFVLVFLVVLLIGKWLFPFLFGATFSGVQVPLLLLLPGIYGLSVISFLSNFFSGKGNVFISVRAAAVALVVVVAGDALFVFQHGIEAAAIVSSVGYLTMFGWYAARFRNETGVSFLRFFLIDKEDRLMLKYFLSKKKA